MLIDGNGNPSIKFSCCGKHKFLRWLDSSNHVDIASLSRSPVAIFGPIPHISIQSQNPQSNIPFTQLGIRAIGIGYYEVGSTIPCGGQSVDELVERRGI